MSSLNISVLAQGREFYLRQLKLHLTPLIFEGLVSLYEDAKDIETEKNEFDGNVLKQFQKLLCQIPTWNQSILEEETRRILTECDFLMEMVAAVFVAHVQILASVKLGGKNSKIRVKIPTSDIFIHAIYTKSAETFYYKPFHFQTYHDNESKDYIKEMINKNIDDIIDNMIPIESIIKEYISNVFTSHTKDNPRTIETTEPEAPGTVLDHNDLGLDNDDDNDNFGHDNNNFGHDNNNLGHNNFGHDDPINDDFGTGKGNKIDKTLGIGEGGDDFGLGLDIGKDIENDAENNDLNSVINDSVINDMSTDHGNGLKFKDDETDIFSSKEESSPFKDAIGESKDPIFKPMENNDNIDPFKSKSEDDPFKTDIFKTDPFKDDSGIGSGIGSGLDDIPNPPELDNNSIFGPKEDKINFFDELP